MKSAFCSSAMKANLAKLFEHLLSDDFLVPENGHWSANWSLQGIRNRKLFCGLFYVWRARWTIIIALKSPGLLVCTVYKSSLCRLRTSQWEAPLALKGEKSEPRLFEILNEYQICQLIQWQRDRIRISAKWIRPSIWNFQIAVWA